jgi:hypothetical protein
MDNQRYYHILQKKKIYLIYRSTKNQRIRAYYKKCCNILSKVIVKVKKSTIMKLYLTPTIK